jgi:hypothetical protein
MSEDLLRMKKPVILLLLGQFKSLKQDRHDKQSSVYPAYHVFLFLVLDIIKRASIMHGFQIGCQIHIF